MRQTAHPLPQDHRDSYTVGGAVFVALLAPLSVVALSAPTLVLAAALGALTALLSGPVTERIRSIRGSVGSAEENAGRAKTNATK